MLNKLGLFLLTSEKTGIIFKINLKILTKFKGQETHFKFNSRGQDLNF